MRAAPVLRPRGLRVQGTQQWRRSRPSGPASRTLNAVQTSSWLGGAKLDRSGPLLQAVLHEQHTMPKCPSMGRREKWAKFLDSPVVEWSIFAAGVLLIVAGLVIAPLPGPGG